jgi:hypothetical protein
MIKRKRSQVGARISPWEPVPSKPQLSIRCPLCSRTSWWHRAFDMVPDGAGGLTEAWDPWEPAPIAYKAMLRYPRRPDGGKGFSWELIPEHKLEQANPGLVDRIQRRFAERAIRWLKAMGYVVTVARPGRALELR